MKKLALLLGVLLLIVFSVQAQKTVMPVPRIQFLSTSGVPLAAGKLHTFETLTTTPLATFTDSGGGTPNSNPVILDAGGFASVWLTPGTLYTFQLDDANDVLQWTEDNVAADNLLALANTWTTLQTFTAGIVADSVNNVRKCDAFAGADFGAKWQAAHDDLPSAGGVADCRGLEGAQAAAATVTISKKVMTLMGGTTLTLASGVRIDFTSNEAGIIGLGRGVTTIESPSTAEAIRLGVVAGSSVSRVRLENFTLAKTGTAREASSIGIAQFGGQGIQYWNIQANSFETGILLDGDGGDVAIVEVPMGFVRLSANLIDLDMTGVMTSFYSRGMHIVGPGKATAGSFGVRQENNVGQGGYFSQTSIEKVETGIQQGGNLWYWSGLRMELIDDGITFAGSAADANTFLGVHTVNVTNDFLAPPSGANANVAQVNGKFNFLTDGATQTSVMTFFDGATSKLNFVYDPTLNRFKFDSVGGGDILTIEQATERVMLGTDFSTSGILNFPNNLFLAARNAANSANFNLVGLNSSNQLELAASGIGALFNDWLRALRINPLEGTLSNTPRWIFKLVDFGDMTAGATADTFTLWTLPANTMIHDVVGTVATGWSGGSISAAVCSVGTNAGAANDLTLDDDFFAAATVYELHDATASGGKGTLLFDATDKFAPHMFVAGGVVEIQCDLTGDNHVNATAGQARIYILVSQPLGNTATEAN